MAFHFCKPRFSFRASLPLASAFISLSSPAFARAGGGGGGGGGFGGGGFGGGGFGHGGGHTSPGEAFIAFIILLIILAIKYYNKKEEQDKAANIPDQPSSFPDGLDTVKISNSFLAIQDAWQRQDLTDVRKWLSDGMYQRFSTQFNMMRALDQRNTLSNIVIKDMVCCGTHLDGRYQTAEIAISFSMNDAFSSGSHPQFNESYPNDTAVEYWTFIKRADNTSGKNLYDNNTCPNCGAPLEIKLGEISRCSNCHTLTNSAAYDWVLSEITQKEDYTGGAGLANDNNLKHLMQADAYFAVQRTEDVASNIYMQVMEALTAGDEKRLSYFAAGNIVQQLLQQKKQGQAFVFDRLYLNSVTLTGYKVEDGFTKLYFDLKATFRRVLLNDGKLRLIDEDFVKQDYRMELSRSASFKSNTGETVYSYECSSCGAPFTDTMDDCCAYCGAPVLDIQRNWVLTGFVQT